MNMRCLFGLHDYTHRIDVAERIPVGQYMTIYWSEEKAVCGRCGHTREVWLKKYQHLPEIRSER